MAQEVRVIAAMFGLMATRSEQQEKWNAGLQGEKSMFPGWLLVLDLSICIRIRTAKFLIIRWAIAK